MPPYLIDMRFRRPDGTPMRIWLPLFLLWPLLIVAAALVLLVTIVVDVALAIAGQKYHYYTFLLAGAFGLLSDLRGLTVRIQDADTLVDIAFK